MSFVRYNPEDSVVSSEEVIKGLFSGDVNGLSLFFTSSVSEYYTDVYNASPSTNPSASVQFSAQYGNDQMLTIETDLAETALWMMAEYLPGYY